MCHKTRRAFNQENLSKRVVRRVDDDHFGSGRERLLQLLRIQDPVSGGARELALLWVEQGVLTVCVYTCILRACMYVRCECLCVCVCARVSVSVCVCQPLTGLRGTKTGSASHSNTMGA